MTSVNVFIKPDGKIYSRDVMVTPYNAIRVLMDDSEQREVYVDATAYAGGTVSSVSGVTETISSGTFTFSLTQGTEVIEMVITMGDGTKLLIPIETQSWHDRDYY